MTRKVGLLQKRFLGTLALIAIVLLSMILLFKHAQKWNPVHFADASSEESGASTAILANGTSTTTVFLPAVMRDYPPPPPVFGVEMSEISASHGVARAAEADVYWVRRNGIKWHEVEATQGVRDWTVLSSFEDELELAHQNDLVSIVVVRGTPTWAQKVPGSSCGPIEQEDLGNFANFMKALVNRYKGSPYYVKYWELGNEPDASTNPGDGAYGCWGEPDDYYFGGRYYGEMLQVVYPAIKEADPEAQVLVGGLLLDYHPQHPDARTNPMARFLEGILITCDGQDCFDIVSFHGYPHYTGQLEDWEVKRPGNWDNWGGIVAGKAEYINEVLSKYGLDKPLMHTEGALICPSDICSELTTDFAEAQADYVVQLYTRNMALDIMATVWFTLEGPGWRWSGLLDSDMDPKPAYNAFKFMTAELSHARYTGEVTSYSGLKGYAFQGGGKTVQVLWAPDNTTRNINVPGGFTQAFDKYGNSITPTGGQIGIGFSPVYLEIAP